MPRSNNRRYAVLDSNTSLGYRELRHLPRPCVDLRHRPMDTEEILQGIDRYHMKHGQPPTRVRLNRATMHRLGNPTALYGFPVTL